MKMETADYLAIIAQIYHALRARGAGIREFGSDIFALLGEISVAGGIEIERDCPFHAFLQKRLEPEARAWHFIHFREPPPPVYVGKNYEICDTTMYVRPPGGASMIEFHWDGSVTLSDVPRPPKLVGCGIPSYTDERMIRGIGSNVDVAGLLNLHDAEVARGVEILKKQFDPVSIVGLDSDKPTVVGVNEKGEFEPIEGGITKADVAAAISIPFQVLPVADVIRGPRYVLGEKKAGDGKIEFYAYEKSALDEADDLRELNAKLLAKDDIEQYENEQGFDVKHQPCGYTSIDVLQDLWGMPYNNLILAYILGLQPSMIQVGNCQTCDARTNRVHVSLSVDKKTVTRITQEVRVGYGTGYDVGVAKRCLQKGQPLPEKGCSGVVGHTAGLERVDFT